MEYMILKNKLPAHLLRQVSGYIYDDQLTREFHKYVWMENIGAINFQIALYAIYYSCEVIIIPNGRALHTREIMPFARYVFEEVEDLRFW